MCSHLCIKERLVLSSVIFACEGDKVLYYIKGHIIIWYSSTYKYIAEIVRHWEGHIYSLDFNWGIFLHRSLIIITFHHLVGIHLHFSVSALLIMTFIFIENDFPVSYRHCGRSVTDDINSRSLYNPCYFNCIWNLFAQFPFRNECSYILFVTLFRKFSQFRHLSSSTIDDSSSPTWQ